MPTPKDNIDVEYRWSPSTMKQVHRSACRTEVISEAMSGINFWNSSSDDNPSEILTMAYTMKEKEAVFAITGLRKTVALGFENISAPT